MTRKTGRDYVPKFDEAELARAIEAGRRRRESRLHAVSAKYVAATDEVEVELSGSIKLICPRTLIEEFTAVAPEVMEGLTVSPRGSALEVDAADVHIEVHGLLASLLSAGDMAKALARHGRKATSDKQAEAARRNGLKGGRPRKNDAVVPPKAA